MGVGGGGGSLMILNEGRMEGGGRKGEGAA